jgi:hypothetical protein
MQPKSYRNPPTHLSFKLNNSSPSSPSLTSTSCIRSDVGKLTITGRRALDPEAEEEDERGCWLPGIEVGLGLGLGPGFAIVRRRVVAVMGIIYPHRR